MAVVAFGLNDNPMRIFFACDTSPNARIESDLWRVNLYQPLVDLGHDVIEFDYDLRETFLHLDPAKPENKDFIEENRPKVSTALLSQIEKAHAEKPIDLFFSYFYDACVLPNTIESIKALGIKTVNWYCNGSYQLHLVREIAPRYDWCLVPEKFRLDDYRAMRANPIYCQEAANPTVYKPMDLPYTYEVSFVGQAYGDRPTYIKTLVAQNIPIRVWGRGWQQLGKGYRLRQLISRKPYQALSKAAKSLFGSRTLDNTVELPDAILGGVLSDAEMIALFSHSKINLGFSSCGNTHEEGGRRILQVRLRDFEIPMSGGFYMVEYMEELEAFFEIDREIVCYRDASDLAGKIRYYLRHEDDREAIRQAGYARCLRDHSWQKRFSDAFTVMGLQDKSAISAT